VLEAVLDWSGLRATLGRNKGAVLAFTVGPNLTFGFFIDHRSIVLRKLGRSSEILEAVLDFLNQKQVGNTASSSGREGGEALFRMLVGPFAEELGRNALKLIVCPDSLLHYLPFEALVWPSAGKGEPGRFLLETHQVSYVPSVHFWQNLLNKRKGSGNKGDLLALGNSNAPIEDFRRAYLPVRTPPLRYADAEAAAVAREYDRRSRKLLTGRKARESAFKSAAALPWRLLHIAAHGIYDDGNWWRSALVLGGSADGDEDGFLSPLEVAMMDLDVSLVILSGCQTNLGLVHQGGGVSGFTQAFLKAGATAVISSDWTVDDRSTSLFMRDFHGYVALGWQPAAALRQAKLNFLRTKFKHPFFWAAYVLTGDGGWKP
jgi:CHAT domain-containing protein